MPEVKALEVNVTGSVPLHLRLSLTDHCQLGCVYCRPAVRQPSSPGLNDDQIVALVAALAALRPLGTLRLTGGEPLLRPGLPELVARLAALGIEDLALTTNGLGLVDLAPRLRAAGLRRVNISLDALDPEIFARVSGGGQVAAVRAGIGAAQAAGLRPIKLNTVVIAGVNDGQIEALLDHALDLGCEQRFIELMPIGPGADWFEQGFLATATIRARLAQGYDLRPLGREGGRAAARGQVIDAQGRHGTVGFISSCSDPFCAACARLRISADGRLLGCLARDDGIALPPLLASEDPAALGAAVNRALAGKRSDARFAQSQAMVEIGG